MSAPWMPAGPPRIVVTRFWSRCVWCGGELGRHTEAIFYSGARVVAHPACHAEATP